MTPEALDYFFPFLVLLYGVVMVFTLSNPYLMALAETRFSSEILQKFKSHLFLGWICVGVGLLWSLQNLVFAN